MTDAARVQRSSSALAGSTRHPECAPQGARPAVLAPAAVGTFLRSWAAASVAAVALALALAPPAQAAGRAEVRYVEPERFSDVGRGALDRERVLAALGAQFERLAARLPDGRTLRVEVLDVDLAGALEPTRGGEVRVLRGTTDAPRITVRWTLLEGERTLRGGVDRVSDLGYLFDAGPRARDGEFSYEARMLERWFDENVAPAK
ncbi:MAG: DUF3016 domain-containing protein [Pseudomonadota bacterium]